jgi:hypothetical protein
VQEDVTVTGPDAYDQYRASAEVAHEKLKRALNRNPNDTVAWDAHHDEVEAARAVFREADPRAHREMLVANMNYIARLSTPPASDHRTGAEKARDARYLPPEDSAGDD